MYINNGFCQICEHEKALLKLLCRNWNVDSSYITLLNFVKLNTLHSPDWEGYPHVLCSTHCSSSIFSTLLLQNLNLVWTVLMSCQRAKQLLCSDWSYIKLLNFVKLSTLLIEKGSHKRYATPTALVVVWALWSFKVFIRSELY